MKTQKIREFTEAEHHTWGLLFRGLDENRRTQACETFTEGVAILGLGPVRIPDLAEINRKLGERTGWKGIPVEGYEDGHSFYPALARKEYPVGNFIRGPKDISYTPAPDVFHDLYGHLPFFANPAYAAFCQQVGEKASLHRLDHRRFRMWERFFWYAVEFSLLETDYGLRIFGAGLLSSRGESDFALSARPEVRAFDVEEIIQKEFSIDKFQETLFVLHSPEQLYDSLPELEAAIQKS